MGIIEELYSGSYRSPFHPSEQYKEFRDEHIRLMEKVNRALGFKFIGELEESEAPMRIEEEEAAFRDGFHLGAMLMLELLYTPQQ